ncbi:hypothetical protein [Jiangella asiatica]|uniref:hypothetical protein n=1 Tax=Jiangella asiatica TaxID=2530372 RepID=UPI0013A5CAC9|nr:hypothetical protein [Jiangella asiatica]
MSWTPDGQYVPLTELDERPVCGDCGGTGAVRVYVGYRAGGTQTRACPTCVLGIPEAEL